MSNARGHWRGYGLVLLALGTSAYACGGSGEGPKTGAALRGDVSGVAADDRSRCDFKGRSDREVVESIGAGSKKANIRRVYGVVGEGEERHRVLLCREVDTNLDGVKDVVRTYTDKGDALNEVADTNFDGKMDTLINFAKGRVAKRREDHNGDGQDDETRFYVSGQLSRAQIDTNYDSRPDVWEIYDDGKLERRGVDLDFDGHVDRWDRDEIALREIEQKDAEAEKAAAAAAAAAAVASGSGGAGPTGARARNK
ncbi:MAG TPA: hypothetical protein VGC79_32115 [Polyangiaceae bacterium]